MGFFIKSFYSAVPRDEMDADKEEDASDYGSPKRQQQSLHVWQMKHLPLLILSTCCFLLCIIVGVLGTKLASSLASRDPFSPEENNVSVREYLYAPDCEFYQKGRSPRRIFLSTKRRDLVYSSSEAGGISERRTVLRAILQREHPSLEHIAPR